MNVPASFEAELDALQGVSIVRDVKAIKKIGFALVFVRKQQELDKLSAALASKAEGDALLWFAYPKGTSKKYKCEFNRDSGWDVIRAAGFDSVRMVEIDEDWSALRFRHTDFIKR